MSCDLVLYSNPMSRGRIARWMLEELGQPYAVEQVGYDDMHRAPFLAINPMGKVPVLRHGDAIVTETAAICAYLAAAFPEAGLMPAPGTPASADYHRWLFFAAGPVEAAVTAKAMGVLPPADKKRSVGFGTYDEMLAALETAVAGKAFVAGDRFSAADVYVGSQIGWSLRFRTIEARPAFTAYWAGLEQRPAYLRAAALDDEAMAQAQG